MSVLHLPFFSPLEVLSTEYWAKSIRKSGIESWIRGDFLRISLQVTSFGVLIPKAGV